MFCVYSPFLSFFLLPFYPSFFLLMFSYFYFILIVFFLLLFLPFFPSCFFFLIFYFDYFISRLCLNFSLLTRIEIREMVIRTPLSILISVSLPPFFFSFLPYLFTTNAFFYFSSSLPLSFSLSFRLYFI